jgi:hypothetical protein
VKLPSTINLATYGGTGSGAVTYVTTAAGCSISGNKLTVTDTTTARTCVVTATKGESLGYSSTKSDPVSFNFELP